MTTAAKALFENIRTEHNVITATPQTLSKRMTVLRSAIDPRNVGRDDPAQHGECASSQEPIDDRAIHDQPSRTERLAIEPGQESAFDQPEDGKLFGHPGAVAFFDCGLRPHRRVEVPDRAVVGRDSRNSAKDIQRRCSVRKRAVEALTLWVVLASRTVEP